MFKKIELEKATKEWLKKSIIIVLILWIMSLITNFAGFSALAIGYCIGCVVCAIKEYLYEKRRNELFNEMEEELVSNLENNNENEV